VLYFNVSTVSPSPPPVACTALLVAREASIVPAVPELVVPAKETLDVTTFVSSFVLTFALAPPPTR
jgi:hypothetical protein